MKVIATITSKRQLTIPIIMYKKLRLEDGDKVVVEEMAGELKIKRALDIVDELAGSVDIPKHLIKVDIDKAIKESKKLHFKNKE